MLRSVWVLILIFAGTPNCIFAQNKDMPVGLMPPGAGLGSALRQQDAAKPTEVKVTIQPSLVQQKPSERFSPGSYEEFISAEKGCKGGDAGLCVLAGKILQKEAPPKEIFDLGSTQRINRALRIYESAINSGNLEAMELAYDLYLDPNLINRETNSYTDKGRAKELLDQMLKVQYSGGQVRLARDYLDNPEYLLSIGKKKEACVIVKQLNMRSDLTDSTKGVLKSLNDGVICKIAS